MSRRAVIAAVAVAIALTVGIVRGVSHHDTANPAAPQSAAPTVSVAPATSVSPTRPVTASPADASTTTAAGPGSGPVDEGAGEDASATDARDTGPTAAGDTAERRRWEPVATGFSRAFTTIGGDTTTTWRARLRPYVTDAVDKQLTTVDVANVPQGHFDGLDVLDVSDEQVTVQATYRPGWALVLYLVSDGHDHWKVYRYDRLEQ